MSLLGRRPSAVYTVCDADAALGAGSPEWEGAGDPVAEPPTEDLGEIVAMRQPMRREHPHAEGGHPLAEGEHPLAGREHRLAEPEYQLAGGEQAGAARHRPRAPRRRSVPAGGDREPWVSTGERRERPRGRASAGAAAAVVLLAGVAAAISYLAVGSLGGRGASAGGPPPAGRAASSSASAPARGAAASASTRGASAAASASTRGAPAAASGPVRPRAGLPAARATAPAAGFTQAGHAHIHAHTRPGAPSHARENLAGASPRRGGHSLRRHHAAPGTVPASPVDERPAVTHTAPSRRRSLQPASESAEEPAERDPAQPAPPGAGSSPSPSAPACAAASCRPVGATAEFGFER